MFCEVPIGPSAGFRGSCRDREWQGVGLMGARRPVELAELDEDIRDEVGHEAAEAERRKTFFYVWRRGGVSINLKKFLKLKTKNCFGKSLFPRGRKQF